MSTLRLPPHHLAVPLHLTTWLRLPPLAFPGPQALTVAFTFLVTVILLNVLVAVMSDT